MQFIWTAAILFTLTPHAFAGRNIFVSMDEFNASVEKSCGRVDYFIDGKKIEIKKSSAMIELRSYTSALHSTDMDLMRRNITPFPLAQENVGNPDSSMRQIGKSLNKIFSQSDKSRFEHTEGNHQYELGLDRTSKTAMIHMEEFSGTSRQLTTRLKFAWPLSSGMPVPTSIRQEVLIYPRVSLGWGKLLREGPQSNPILTITQHANFNGIPHRDYTSITRFSLSQAPFQAALNQELRIFRLLLYPGNILNRMFRAASR